MVQVLSRGSGGGGDGGLQRWRRRWEVGRTPGSWDVPRLTNDRAALSAVKGVVRGVAQQQKPDSEAKLEPVELRMLL